MKHPQQDPLEGPSSEPSEPPRLVGWKEYVGFPEWGIDRVKVKIDTGARTSALGVQSYELREADGRGLIAQLRLGFRRKKPEAVMTVEAPVLRTVVVRNSAGMPELRPLIETVVCLGNLCKRVRFTITHRAAMRFPIILGRKALEGDFIVDVSKKYLLQQ
jgi:hypothetical protein